MLNPVKNSYFAPFLAPFSLTGCSSEPDFCDKKPTAVDNPSLREEGGKVFLNWKPG